MGQQKTIRFTGYNQGGIYIEENNNTNVFVPISETNANIAFEILRKKLKGELGNLISFKDIVPRNVLKYEQADTHRELLVMWYTKPSKRFLNHIDKTKTGIVYYPPLIWYYKKGSLYLYAIKDKEPTLGTKLFKMPFPNMYGNGDLCFGSNRAKKVKNINELILDMEAIVYSSKYSHGLNTSPMLCREPEVVFKKMFNGKLKKFPLKELAPANKLLKDILW